jgi:hypothetical protein
MCVGDVDAWEVIGPSLHMHKGHNIKDVSLNASLGTDSYMAGRGGIMKESDIEGS